MLFLLSTVCNILVLCVSVIWFSFLAKCMSGGRFEKRCAFVQCVSKWGKLKNTKKIQGGHKPSAIGSTTTIVLKALTS